MESERVGGGGGGGAEEGGETRQSYIWETSSAMGYTQNSKLHICSEQNVESYVCTD